MDQDDGGDGVGVIEREEDDGYGSSDGYEGDDD